MIKQVDNLIPILQKFIDIMYRVSFLKINKKGLTLSASAENRKKCLLFSGIIYFYFDANVMFVIL